MKKVILLVLLTAALSLCLLDAQDNVNLKEFVLGKWMWNNNTFEFSQTVVLLNGRKYADYKVVEGDMIFTYASTQLQEYVNVEVIAQNKMVLNETIDGHKQERILIRAVK